MPISSLAVFIIVWFAVQRATAVSSPVAKLVIIFHGERNQSVDSDSDLCIGYGEFNCFQFTEIFSDIR
ncbi:hypothetical protein EUTSA_v10028021mg [Eutrema salsugineum]|uniref:Uncharacterized protein n=1 Tax=Eutrema salsugineum TaxID=72664 RepID=V4M3J9_EUTSA|nr:hypothetical protein EUTSA_v10028021mg [Eutrema salsugineum]